MKRFWQRATLVEAGGYFRIELDGKPMRLPGGPLLLLAQKPLAEAIAAEWQDVGGGPGNVWRVEDVPLTRLAGTAQERIAPDPAPTIDAMARYAETDLLCYRASTPQALAERQDLAWQPLLDWAEQEFGARLRVVRGIMPERQPEQAVAALRQALAASDAFALAGLGIVVPATGSLVLGLAVLHRRLTAHMAHELAMLDELFQVESWGEDMEAATRRAHLGQDIRLAGQFIDLVRC